MLFSEPLYFGITRIFSAKSNPVLFISDDSLKGKTICNPAGFVVYPAIKAALDAKTLRIQEPGDLLTCVKFLDLGRADFLISPVPAISPIMAELGLTDKLTYAEKPYSENASFLIVGKSTPGAADFLKQFNQALATYRDSPAYPTLVKKHGLESAVK